MKYVLYSGSNIVANSDVFIFQHIWIITVSVVGDRYHRPYIVSDLWYPVFINVNNRFEISKKNNSNWIETLHIL